MHTIDLTKTKKFLKILFDKFFNDGTTDLAAQLAYYFLLSIFPLLLFVLTLLPYLSLDTHIMVEFIRTHAPGETGQLIADNVRSVLSQPRGGLLSFGLIATLWTASNGISALIRSINSAYHVKETRSFVKVKLLAIILTIAMVIVIAITLLLPVFGQLIFNTIRSFIYIPLDFGILFQLSRWILGSIIMVLVLMVLYRVAPNTTFKLKGIFWGALFATVTWQLISLGFSFYVSNFSHYTATYGALGGIIILMIWFYLTGLLLIIGGQINATVQQLNYDDDKIT